MKKILAGNIWGVRAFIFGLYVILKFVLGVLVFRDELTRGCIVSGVIEAILSAFLMSYTFKKVAKKTEK